MYILPIILFIFGLFAGSFFGVITDRLQKREKGILFGRSHCDFCKYVLKFFDLIPVFSWIFLGGKCRKCRKIISIKHPLIEIFTAGLFGFVAILTPIDSASDYYLLAWRIFIVSILWLITISDIRYMEIPDKITIPSFVILLAVSAIVTFAFPYFPIPKLIDALMGALILGAFFGAQILFSVFYKKDIIGGGDLRIGAIMGVILGWKIALVALFISYLFGTIAIPLIMILGKKGLKSKIPLGPFLALGTAVCLFFGDWLVGLWMGIVGII